MGNRCTDCNKFVSLETPEPEENSFDFELTEDGVNIVASLTQYRECAECGTQLKSFEHEIEEEVSWVDIGIKIEDLTEKQRESFLLLGTENRDDSIFKVEAEADGCSSDESGGGRWQKNEISCHQEVCITVKCPEIGIDIKHSVTLSSSCAASDFEEC